MTSREVTKLLKGKRIARVDLNSGGVTNAGTQAQHVQIYMDDGTSLRFHVQEMPDGGDYGVSMMISRAGASLFTNRPGGKL